MSQPAARLGDMHTCPMVTPGVPPIPHVGGPIAMGVPTVLIGGQPAATVTHPCVCVGPPDSIAMGSPTVLIANQQAARQGDPTTHGGLIAVGFPTVLIGFTAVLEALVAGVNPAGSTINCGNIVDAAIDRLTGADPNAAAPDAQDGTFEAIATRHGTAITWGTTLDSAFDTVRAGGDGTIAIVGIEYSGGTASHVVVMANEGGNVVILEGQDWGSSGPREVIGSPERANERYNSDGGSAIGIGVVRTGRP